MIRRHVSGWFMPFDLIIHLNLVEINKTEFIKEVVVEHNAKT